MRVLGGRYRLDERIGAGGMAEVWSAHDAVLDRPVAVKLVSVEATGPEAVQRARNEARSAARLAHPNVAAVYDFGTSQRGGRGDAYLVMEVVEGGRLTEYLRRGPLHPKTAIRVCAEVSAGLAAAHSHGIVHRDIKPANIVLTQAGAKILDFGIAARAGEVDGLPDGQIEGTAAYLAPERLRGDPVTTASDMYGLGILLFLCLTARLPWNATTHDELLYAHQWRAPEPMPEIPGLPADAAEICARCLDKDPSGRPSASAAALILAASVGAQVYLPPIPRPEPPAGRHTAPAPRATPSPRTPSPRAAAVPLAAAVPRTGRRRAPETSADRGVGEPKTRRS